MHSSDDTVNVAVQTHGETGLIYVTHVTVAFFFLSASTGVIYTAGILDCEAKDSYWLIVYATDRGVTPLSASIEVFIQVPTLYCQYSR